MTTRDALLNAIALNPDADAPRLVYADFLDETGDASDAARARLVRAQVRACRLLPSDPEVAELKRVVNALWDRHKSEWFPGVSSDRLPYPDRGFITHWGCYSAADIAARDVPFAREPICDLTLSVNGADELAGVELWPELARVRELKVWPNATEDAALLRLFSSPHLTGLRKLDLMGHIDRPWHPIPETLRLLATAPQYAGLESLSITHAEVGDEGARTLATSPTLRNLTALGLAGSDVGLDGWCALLASPVVANVPYLSFGGAAQTEQAGEALADTIARAHLPRLEGIGLDETAFTDRAAELLAGAKALALKRLMICPHNANHSDQFTGYATISAAGVECLSRAPWASSIEHLKLSGQSFGDAGALALARDRRFKCLRSLTLMRCGISEVGLGALIGAYAEQLELLQLAHNPFGDAGAALIAGAEWPKMVPLTPGAEYEQRGIFVAQCALTETGVKALAHSTTIPRDIPDLFIGDAPVSNAVVARLRAKYPNAYMRFE